MASFNITFEETDNFIIGVKDSESVFPVDFESGGASYPVYDGEYVIIPQAFDETVLPTNGKVLTDDITVNRVPYFETHSQTGITVYIASEVN